LSSPIRSRRLAAAALLLVLGGAAYGLASAGADDPKTTTTGQGLALGNRDGAQPTTMAQFLTAVTDDVDAYWTKTLQASGLPAPKVRHEWIPAGQTVASACGDESGRLGDDAAAYCPQDDTIYISQKFATDIYDGALDGALPGSSEGYGGTSGDFAVAYVVAHEFGHEIQQQLGLFDRYGQSTPTMGFELQADCYAGTWAKSANDEGRLDDGDVQEALDAALAVGDFDTANPGHHGTPDQREEAWSTGFQSGDPSSCDTYLDPANLGDDSAAPGEDTGYGVARQAVASDARRLAGARV
jgi:predicted metalloprotease